MVNIGRPMQDLGAAGPLVECQDVAYLGFRSVNPANVPHAGLPHAVDGFAFRGVRTCDREV
jgi:hypothetical protein